MDSVERNLDPYHDHGDNGVGTRSKTYEVIAIVAHYCIFPAATFAFHAVLTKYQVFSQRIWSPFFVLISLVIVQVAFAFGISEHYYVSDWYLGDEDHRDLIAGTFSVLNRSFQIVLAIGLRKQGLPLFRLGESTLEWTVIVLDLMLLTLIAVFPILYALAGSDVDQLVLTVVLILAGILVTGRIWHNLGPNKYTKVGGVSMFSLVICGAVVFKVYSSTGEEWLHILTTLFLTSSFIPMSIAFRNAESKEPEEEQVAW